MVSGCPRHCAIHASSAYCPPAISLLRSHRRIDPVVHGSSARPMTRPAVFGIEEESGCTVVNANRPPGRSQRQAFATTRSSNGVCSARTPIE
jgi:hypothetical protein